MRLRSTCLTSLIHSITDKCHQITAFSSQFSTKRGSSCNKPMSICQLRHCDRNDLERIGKRLESSLENIYLLILVLLCFLERSFYIVTLSSAFQLHAKTLQSESENFTPAATGPLYKQCTCQSDQRSWTRTRKTCQSAPLLAEFAVEHYHRHTLGLADKLVDI